MNILMILSNPFIVDPRVHKEATSLVEAGHSVTLIVWDRKGEYKSEENLDGVRVLRLKNTGLMQLLGSDLFRNPLWWRRAFAQARMLYETDFQFDVVHCHDLDTLRVGVWLKKRYGITLVYDAHEIFGYMVMRTMPRFVANRAFTMEKRLVRFVDHVITAEETYFKYFQSLGCNKLTSVLNCKDLISDTYQPSLSKQFTVVYIGVLNHSRFFPECVEVLGGLKNVRFLIAGKKENLYDEIKELCRHFSNVEFLGTIPYYEVVSQTLAADVVLCMIKPSDINNRIATANKQFEAMVCGRPIICTKGTRSGEITKQEQCGLVVEYSKQALTDAVCRLRDDAELCESLGKNALKAALTSYNWEKEKQKLLEVYASFGR